MPDALPPAGNELTQRKHRLGVGISPDCYLYMRSSTKESVLTSTPSAVRDFRPDIQGLRAIAVLGVVLYHAGVAVIPGGYAGVDVFFVISGFLITSHLARTLRSTGSISFADFYLKRARRILPASMLVMVLTTIAAYLWIPRVDVPGALQDAAATALYVPNLLFAVQGTDYLAETAPSPFQHYWSLGIEEQFYLLWPAVLAVAFLAARKSPRGLLAVAAVMVLGSFSVNLLLMQVSTPWAFFSLPSRAWELGVGAVIALLPSTVTKRAGTPVAGAVLTYAGLAGITASFVLLSETTPFPGFAALLPVLATASTILGGSGAAAHPRALSNGPTQAIGRWSYSIYLVHWPLLTIPQLAAGTENPLPLVLTLALGAASVPLAVLMYRYVEEPLRKPWRSPLNTTRRSLALVAGVSAICAVTALTTAQAVDRSRITTDETAGFTAGTRNPEGTPYVPSNIDPALEEAGASVPDTYADGCHLDQLEIELAPGCQYGADDTELDMVLFGDSHAQQWFGALQSVATESSYRLHTLTKSSCPSVDLMISVKDAPYTQCEDWKKKAIKAIHELDPEVIVLANYGRVQPADPSAPLEEQWAEGLASMIDQMPADAEVVILADTPEFPVAPASCLSRNLEEADACSVLREDGVDLSRQSLEKDVALREGAHYVDLTAYLCTDTCPAIIGNVLAYRDEHHISRPMSLALGEPLATALAGII